MKGFKEFLMRGNLIELAVAVIIATAFGKVVEKFTKIIMDIIGLIGGKPNFDDVAVGPINVGQFITALVSFVMIAAIVYFGVILPYNKMRKRFEKKKEEEVSGPSQEELLTEIRDLLKQR